MKKIIVSLIITLLVFSMMACDPSNATQEEIIKRASDLPYELLDITNMQDLLPYYNNTLGIHLARLELSRPGFIPYFLSHSNSNINITELDKVSRIQCLRKISDNRVYTIHRYAQDVLFYAFYSYSDGSWITDREVYCASKRLSKSDFADVEIGDNLTEVISIDPAQEVSFDPFKEVQFDEKIVTKHLVDDGLLTIEYVDSQKYGVFNPDTTIITGMEWSPLPILEQDLPK